MVVSEGVTVELSDGLGEGIGLGVTVGVSGTTTAVDVSPGGGGAT